MEQKREERKKKITKAVLITISVLFIGVMLILPLFSILFSALKEGIGFYLEAISTEYVKSALLVTLLATVIAVVVNTFFGIVAAWLLTKFSFRGKQILFCAQACDIYCEILFRANYDVYQKCYRKCHKKYGRIKWSL